MRKLLINVLNQIGAAVKSYEEINKYFETFSKSLFSMLKKFPTDNIKIDDTEESEDDKGEETGEGNGEAENGKSGESGEKTSEKTPKTPNTKAKTPNATAKTQKDENGKAEAKVEINK